MQFYAGLIIDLINPLATQVYDQIHFTCSSQWKQFHLVVRHIAEHIAIRHLLFYELLNMFS